MTSTQTRSHEPTRYSEGTINAIEPNRQARLFVALNAATTICLLSFGIIPIIAWRRWRQKRAS